MANGLWSDDELRWGSRFSRPLSSERLTNLISPLHQTLPHHVFCINNLKFLNIDSDCYKGPETTTVSLLCVVRILLDRIYQNRGSVIWMSSRKKRHFQFFLSTEQSPTIIMFHVNLFCVYKVQNISKCWHFRDYPVGSKLTMM